MNIGTARLFIGFELDDHARAALSDVRDELKDRNLRGKLYAPQLYHLTLCFLGNTPLERIRVLQQLMYNIHCTPFSLTLSSLGTFKNGSILWAGVEKCNALYEYQSQLAHALRNAGFPIEEGKYCPHITLGRQVRSEIPPISVPPTSFEISHATLFESTRIDNVLTYIPIYRSAFH